MQHPLPRQLGLRRRRAGFNRQHAAFWAGVAILIAFELMLVAKTLPPGWIDRVWTPNAEGALPSDSN